MSRRKTKTVDAKTVDEKIATARRNMLLGNDDYDPGAKLCGHGPLVTKRSHYLGGGLWVCFECFAKLLLGGRKESVQCK